MADTKISAESAGTTPDGTEVLPAVQSAANVKLTTIQVTQAPRSINAQTGTTYTLVAGDQGKVVTLSNAGAIALTVPANASVAFPIGTQIDLLQIGAGQVTVGNGGGAATISSDTGLKISAQYKGATLLKTGTNQWYLFGSLSA
jgi:hypothetical protein